MAAIWAYSKGAPGKTCEDARLLGGGTNIQYPVGNNQGQAGWDIGLMFTNFGDLSERLRKLLQDKSRPINRLAINLHGMPGKIDADSVGTENAMYDYNKLWNRYSSQLTFMNQMLAPGAVVLIMGCNVASGDRGAAFLTDLSTSVFRDHKVVGFTTIGETLGQFRHGEFCTEPGMRDTPYDNSSEGMPKIRAEREKKYLELPWASESSPHSKVALNGKIISGAEPPAPVTDYSFQSYLHGTWSVKIGGWEGYFLFRKDGTVDWTNVEATQRHPGKWWTMSGSVEWSFSDDTPGWKRTFQVLTPLSSTLNGTITINGRAHGFFSMSKQQ
jgi:hypothetical protein